MGSAWNFGGFDLGIFERGLVELGRNRHLLGGAQEIRSRECREVAVALGVVFGQVEGLELLGYVVYVDKLKTSWNLSRKRLDLCYLGCFRMVLHTWGVDPCLFGTPEKRPKTTLGS